MCQRCTFLGGGGSEVRDMNSTSPWSLEAKVIPTSEDLFYTNQPLLSLDNNLKRLIPIILLCLQMLCFQNAWPKKRDCCVYFSTCPYTAISRKVVGKSARDNPERYCGWFWVHSSSKKFERMAGEAMDICLRVLKESKKSRFDSYSR